MYGSVLGNKGGATLGRKGRGPADNRQIQICWTGRISRRRPQTFTPPRIQTQHGGEQSSREGRASSLTSGTHGHDTRTGKIRCDPISNQPELHVPLPGTRETWPSSSACTKSMVNETPIPRRHATRQRRAIPSSLEGGADIVRPQCGSCRWVGAQVLTGTLLVRN